MNLQSPQTYPCHGLRVLVVDDHWMNREMAECILETLGAVVVQAEDGQEAVQLWLDGAFDVVLMDLEMPLMDGPKAIRLIRTAEARFSRPRTAIILVTGASSTASQAAFAAGA